MAENYIEVTLRTDVDSGEILALLTDSETSGCWENEGVTHIFWREAAWTPEKLDELRRILTVLGVNLAAADLTVTTLPDQDWNATWAASITPIRLGRRLRISQSWHPPDPEFTGIELVIDPRRAFGTGYHATTQLIVEWLEANLRGHERVLDVGTGSGILAMVAIRLGAMTALGVDNDPEAIECARDYARVNGFGFELELRVESLTEGATGEFDVIVANIDGRTLPGLCPDLPRLLRPDGRICLSGLQDHDLEEITAALAAAGLTVRRQMRRDEWLALECGRA